jgi:acyl dehydratase
MIVIRTGNPYGTTIAHGNWLVSIVVSKLIFTLFRPIKTGMIINYGWNKIKLKIARNYIS